MLILVDHAFMMLKDAWDSNMLGDNQRTIRKQNANTRNQTKTKREIANGQSFASKRVSLSTFWTRKPKFEVFRQTCSGTIRGQFGDNNIKTKRKRNANSAMHLRVEQKVRTPSFRCLGNYLLLTTYYLLLTSY